MSVIWSGCRIALGPQAGRKVLTLHALPPVDIEEMHSGTERQVAGFNLHAGVVARADQHHKLERLCRYATTRGFGTTPVTDRSAAVHCNFLMNGSHHASLPPRSPGTTTSPILGVR